MIQYKTKQSLRRLNRNIGLIGILAIPFLILKLLDVDGGYSLARFSSTLRSMGIQELLVLFALTISYFILAFLLLRARHNRHYIQEILGWVQPSSGAYSSKSKSEAQKAIESARPDQIAFSTMHEDHYIVAKGRKQNQVVLAFFILFLYVFLPIIALLVVLLSDTRAILLVSVLALSFATSLSIAISFPHWCQTVAEKIGFVFAATLFVPAIICFFY